MLACLGCQSHPPLSKNPRCATVLLCAQLSYTVLIIFPLYLQTTTVAQLMSTGGEGCITFCTVTVDTFQAGQTIHNGCIYHGVTDTTNTLAKSLGAVCCLSDSPRAATTWPAYVPAQLSDTTVDYKSIIITS